MIFSILLSLMDTRYSQRELLCLSWADDERFSNPFQVLVVVTFLRQTKIHINTLHQTGSKQSKTCAANISRTDHCHCENYSHNPSSTACMHANSWKNMDMQLNSFSWDS